MFNLENKFQISDMSSSTMTAYTQLIYLPLSGRFGFQMQSSKLQEPALWISRIEAFPRHVLTTKICMEYSI